MKYFLAAFVFLISGCATMLKPVDKISDEAKYSVVASDKTMWGVLAGTLISDDRQTLFTVHKDIGIDNYLLGGFYTHMQVKSAAEENIKDLKSESEINVKSIFIENLSKNNLISNENNAVKLMPYNWINVNKDKSARLITMVDVEYNGSSKEKTFARVMSISSVKLPLGGDNGWISKNRNLLISETKSNVENIINYLNGSFNGSITPYKNKKSRLKNIVFPSYTESVELPSAEVIYEDDLRYYVFYSGGKLAFGAGVAIYNKNDVSKVE